MHYESRPGDYGYEVVENHDTLGLRIIAVDLEQGMADSIAWMLNKVTDPKTVKIEATSATGEVMTFRDGESAAVFEFEEFDLGAR